MTFSPHTRLRRTGRAASLLTGALLTGAVHAQTYATTVVAPSQAFQYTVTTTAASPTYFRPNVPLASGYANSAFSTFTTQSSVATAYGTASFTPSATNNYSINTTFSGYDYGNFAQFIYSPSFSPAAPTTNAKVGIDQFFASSTEAYNTALTAGTAYTFVNTGYFAASDTNSGEVSVGTSTTTITNLGSTTVVPGPTENVTNAGKSSQAATYTPVAATQTLSVSDTTTIASFDSITIVGLSHPVVGDLLGTLTHTNAGVTTIVDLFDHAGADNNPSDPGYNYGEGSQASFDGNNYTFALSGATLSATADYTNADDTVTYQASGNSATGFDTAHANNTLASFIGQSVGGTWTLSLTDEQPDDNPGSFAGFQFNINGIAAAPEPSPWVALLVGALSLGALALRARRRTQV